MVLKRCFQKGVVGKGANDRLGGKNMRTTGTRWVPIYQDISLENMQVHFFVLKQNHQTTHNRYSLWFCWGCPKQKSTFFLRAADGKTWVDCETFCFKLVDFIRKAAKRSAGGCFLVVKNRPPLGLGGTFKS